MYVQLAPQVEARIGGHEIDDEKAAAIAYLESIIAQAPTDPEELRKADEEFYDFMLIAHADQTMDEETLSRLRSKASKTVSSEAQ